MDHCQPSCAQAPPGLSAMPCAPRHIARWQPGAAPAIHNEIFASGDEGSGAGAALALALDGLRVMTSEGVAGHTSQRGVLWVQDKAAIRLSGKPYLPGLPAPLRGRVVHVAAQCAKDALFALEEGLRCHDFAFVLGELAGNPRVLDFTASRRLSLTAQKHGVPLYLVRLGAARDLSSARMRWDIRAAPSPAARWNAAAPGIASWHGTLFRARSHAPGQWTLRDDGQSLAATRAEPENAAPDTLDLVPQSGAGPLAAHA